MPSCPCCVVAQKTQHPRAAVRPLGADPSGSVSDLKAPASLTPSFPSVMLLASAMLTRQTAFFALSMCIEQRRRLSAWSRRRYSLS